MLTADLLRQRAESQPDRVPIIVDGGTFVTYAEWDRQSNAVAHGLLDLGVRRGDRVALFFGGVDWADYAVAYLGVLKAGGTATHLNDRLDPAELHRRLGHADPVGIVHSGALAPPAMPRPAAWRRTVTALDSVRFTPVPVPVGPDDIADILYTSGTTGPAKPFTNPHGNLSYGRGAGSIAEQIFDAAAAVLSPMPLGTVYSAGTVGIFALTTTAPILVCDADDVERMAWLIERHRVGSAMLTPWTAMRMVNARVADRYDLGTVTTVGIASAAMPARYARDLLAMMPNAQIMTAYGGGSEAVPASIRTSYDPQRPTCVGRPGAGTELRLLDEAGATVSSGEIGEVWLHTDAPKRRYLNGWRGEDVHVDGWTRSRDLAYLGPDGDVYFFDRSVDAIRTGDRLVSSIEVEGALYEHPAVEQVAVVGVPDPELGQLVVALVVPMPHARLESSELRAFTAARLAPYQMPGFVYVVDLLPRGQTGKVLKNQLRAWCADRAS